MQRSYKIEDQVDIKEKESEDGKGARLWLSCRLNLVIMIFIGFCLHYFIRINISLAIVCMVSTTDDNTTTSNSESQWINNTADKCEDNAGNENHTSYKDIEGELKWKRTMMTQVLAAYFYGYVPVQILGGWMASRFGGKHVFGVGMLISTLLTLLTPVAARTHPYFLLALRVLIGAGTGVTFPAANAMYGRWIPKYERSKLIATASIGSITGAVLAFASTGILCNIELDNGWPFAFYLPGITGVVWWVAYNFVVYNTPNDHPRISKSEREFISVQTGENAYSNVRPTSMPWKSMLTSVAVWGIVVGHTADGFGLYTATMVLPMYLKDVLNFNIKQVQLTFGSPQNGFLSALPQICLAVATPIVGYVVDLLRKREYLSTAAVRKICQGLAMTICAGFFIGTSFLDCTQRGLAITLVTIAISSLSFSRVGYMVNNVDIAPRYAGLIYSFTNTIANASGFVIPLMVGVITPNGTREEWQRVFYIHSSILLVGAIGYGLLAKGEVQSWAASEIPATTCTKVESKLLKTSDC